MIPEIKRLALLRLNEVDEQATRLTVEPGLTGDGRIVIGCLNPVRSGFGDRMLVPVSNELFDARRDVGAFLELTREQALDLHAKLGRELYGTDREGA